jgi:hypothetical protein
MTGESLISRARNRQVSDFFYSSEYDYYMTLDADIELLNTDEDNNFFDILTSYTHIDGIIGALVSKRTDAKTMCPFASVPMRSMEISQKSGLVEMRWLGAGVMAINRTVITKMIGEYSHLSYVSSNPTARPYDHALYMPYLYDLGIGQRKYLSEDWAFCQRASDIGIPIFADTSINTMHWGEKGFGIWDQNSKWVVNLQ